MADGQRYGPEALTVVIGGVSVLTLLVRDPAYAENELRQDLWRAGHAHAGVAYRLTATGSAARTGRFSSR